MRQMTPRERTSHSTHLVQGYSESEGATVIVTGTNAKRLEDAAPVLGEKTVALPVDLRHPAQIDKAIADVVETFGRVDVALANAGAEGVTGNVRYTVSRMVDIG